MFFRKAKFWDGGGKDAPPAFQADGVQYLHIKVRPQGGQAGEQLAARSAGKGATVIPATAAAAPAHCALKLPAVGGAEEGAAGRGRREHSPALAPAPATAQVGGLFWVATTRENVSPSLVLELLSRIYWITRVRCTGWCQSACLGQGRGR